jgi:hypothetical protein
MKRRISSAKVAALYLTMFGAAGLIFCRAEGHAQSLPVVLQITSPTDGTVVNPGQLVTVVVTPTRGGSFSKVFLIGEDPIGREMKQVLSGSPPYQFTVTIPKNIVSAKGYFISAMGIAVSGGQSGKSLHIHLDVEPSAAISRISVQPTAIHFTRAGEQIPVTVTGTFADGSTMDITKSSQTTYRSGDTTGVTVKSTGIVTAVGPGRWGVTPVVVQYGNQRFAVQASTKGLPSQPQ